MLAIVIKTLFTFLFIFMKLSVSYKCVRIIVKNKYYIIGKIEKKKSKEKNCCHNNK